MRVTHTEMKMTEVTLLDALTCDKCGADLKYNRDAWSAYQSGWFSMMTGSSYPEGGSGTDYKLDLCEECAKKLLSLLILNDYKVYEKEWDR